MKALQFSLLGSAFRSPEEFGASPDDVAFVPRLIRRKLSMLEKNALSVLGAVAPESPCPTVFASRFGEWRRTFSLLRQLREEGEMSPAGFSLSVHNATPGIFSLVRGDVSAYTAVAATARTIEAGLLEALLMRKPALFVYAEEPVPEFYAPEFKANVLACAFALHLAPGGAFELSAGTPGAAPLTFAALKSFFENPGAGPLVAESFSVKAC